MSYMRGDHYLWSDGSRLHLWVRDGYDGWDEAGWMRRDADEHDAPPSDGRSGPGGVGIEQAVMDEYVVMRFAELLRDGLVDATIDRAVSKHAGNGGCRALREHANVVMTFSRAIPRPPLARDVQVTETFLMVHLTDGRTVSVPLSWAPRLAHGTLAERAEWELIGGGEGIHWPKLDEDISVESLLAGRRSGESRASLQRWLESRGTTG